MLDLKPPKSGGFASACSNPELSQRSISGEHAPTVVRNAQWLTDQTTPLGAFGAAEQKIASDPNGSLTFTRRNRLPDQLEQIALVDRVGLDALWQHE